MNFKIALAVGIAAWLGVTSARAQLVIPQIGGGRIGLANAPMKHADVTFDGVNVRVHVDDSVGTPTLVPLEEPFEFDLDLPWGVLDGKAYNFQYGWNPGGFISLPPDAWIWIEQIDASPGLEVYQRPPALPSYERIFGSNGSVWRWPGSMTHNVYAIERPQQDAFQATYRVFIGDDATGEEIVDNDQQSLYGSDIVTFGFDIELIGDFDESGFLDAPDIDILSRQVREGEYEVPFDLNLDELLSEIDRQLWIGELVGTLSGDADLNGTVDFADFLVLSAAFGAEAGWADGDFDGDHQVQFSDFLLLSQNFGQTPSMAISVPEASFSLFSVTVACGTLLMRMRKPRGFIA